ncbi:MAG: thiamine phosphate synthase [Gemmataceae bacterium]
MFEPCTPAVSRAMELAQALVNSSPANDQEVVPRHVLCALLAEEEGQAFEMLVRSGVVLDKLRVWLPEEFPSPTSESREIRFDERTQELFREARSLCREWGIGKTVSSEALLLALVQGDEVLRESLNGCGVSLAQLEMQVIAFNEGPVLAIDEPIDFEPVTEHVDAARILDANANRAREAVRVVEEYCRFVLDDPGLSRECKTLRHELSAACERLPRQALLSARETNRDVGTSFFTTQEGQRTSPLPVAIVNLKRLQEALRTMEEYGKVLDVEIAAAFEQARYRTYTLERILGLGESAKQRLQDAKLYVLLTGSSCYGSLEWTIREAAQGGATVFQLREKQMADRELWERAKQVRQWTRDVGALFIVNDRPDIARLAEADGVHIGQDELPVKEARRILGPDALVGVSTHDLEQFRQAIEDGASYVGLGPTFPSTTKQFANFPGLDFVRDATALSNIPAFVIGGVTLANLPDVIEAGGKRVAVSGAICGSETPQPVAMSMRLLLENADPRVES